MSTDAKTNLIRKAAILVAALDRQSADCLLDKMPAEDAARVRDYVLRMEEPSADEQAEVMREFLADGRPGWNADGGAVELDADLARRIAAREDYETAAEPARPTAAPFAFLHGASGATLARHLRNETPAVSAAVLVHLPAALAAAIVAELPPRQQAEVLRRIAELRTPDEQAVRMLEHELRTRLAAELEADRNRRQGVATVHTIVNAAGSGRERLLASLHAHDAGFASLMAVPEAATEAPQPPLTAKHDDRAAQRRGAPGAQAGPAQRRSPQRRSPPQSPPASRSESQPHSPRRSGPIATPWPLERLTELDAEGLAAVLRAVDVEVMLLALAGASPEVFAAITQPLSSGEVRRLRKRIAQLSPLRLSDVERAQREIGQVAAELAVQGKVRAPQARRFAAAA